MAGSPDKFITCTARMRDHKSCCKPVNFRVGKLYRIMRSSMRFGMYDGDGRVIGPGYLSKIGRIIVYLDGKHDATTYHGTRIRFIYEDNVSYFGGGLCNHSFEEVNTDESL